MKASGVALVLGLITIADAGPPAVAKWQTAVNQNDAMPGDTNGRTFNSFNQPAVNARGVVLFRARSRGGPGGEPLHGIYLRQPAPAAQIEAVADNRTPVPAPNNLATVFTEFPSVPRLGIHTDNVVTRGNHAPVWQYGDTRTGTTGVYARHATGRRIQPLTTVAAKLGAVPEFERFAVPGLPGRSFEVFPGAPAITDEGIVAFKGNYTDGDAKTGVFFTELPRKSGELPGPTERIADSDTAIPDPGACAPGTLFGSTAPPSAVDDSVLFVGLDDEQDPLCGGIYQASLSRDPEQLRTLVAIGAPVPGHPAAAFTRIGEALSFDGRYVAFWGAWGDETRVQKLDCPTEGQQARRDYCLEEYGNGYPVEVPVQQGIFVHDIVSDETFAIAETGERFSTFLFWNFSGLVPGREAQEDGEPARWRASSFIAVSGVGRTARVAFKARSGALVAGRYVAPVDGLYLGDNRSTQDLRTLVDTTMPGQRLDPEAPPESAVTDVGLERDGFRGPWLAISAKMAVEGDAEDGMAGIYRTRIGNSIVAGD